MQQWNCLSCGQDSHIKDQPYHLPSSWSSAMSLHSVSLSQYLSQPIPSQSPPSIPTYVSIILARNSIYTLLDCYHASLILSSCVIVLEILSQSLLMSFAMLNPQHWLVCCLHCQIVVEWATHEHSGWLLMSALVACLPAVAWLDCVLWLRMRPSIVWECMIVSISRHVNGRSDSKHRCRSGVIIGAYFTSANV